MALTIFMMLSVMSVIFLLYVLVKFWQEGRRTRRATLRQYRLPLVRTKKSVVVVTVPVTAGTNGDVEDLLRFPVQSGGKREYDAGTELPGRTRTMSR
jgi:hypothetical protein